MLVSSNRSIERFRFRLCRLSLVGLLGLTLMGCDRIGGWFSNASEPRLEPLPQDPQVRAYFNHNRAATYRDPYRDIQRDGDNLEREIVETLQQAERRIDIAVQELRLPQIARTLAERHQAGVEVRVVLENNYSRPWSDYTAAEVRQFDERQRSRYEDGIQLIDENGDGELSPTEIRQNDALVVLRNAGIPVIDDTADGSKGSGLMHHKFAVVDGQTTLVGSANFTPSGIHGDLDEPDSRGNANHLLRIESSELAAIFTQEFELMWGDGPGQEDDSLFGLQKPPRPVENLTLGDNLVSVKFSPTSTRLPWEATTNGLIAQALSRARNSIELALFVFSEQAIADAIAKRHQDGVTVRALIDPSFAYRNYSEGLDMLGVALADNQCRYEEENQPWEEGISTVGVPELPPGDLLHHKFAIVDDRTVITGSHNWSNAANVQNDETLLVIQNPVVAAHFEREFDRLYGNSILGLPESVENRIRDRERQCPNL
ncbi:phospholipase D-like domain-containing protein [Baaleninema sp.]|uniref:phospholipase D-like domain-containing protein n=1 Tax=Baaleninema sp. TaxID=3101197 RepID=UPI003D059416